VIFGGGPGSEAAIHLPVSVPLVGDALHLGIEAIAHFADFMLLTGLIVVNLAIIRSRRKNPDIERPFQVPGVPAVPIVAVIANLVLLVNVEPASFLLGIVAELVGVVLWFTVIGTTEPGELEAQTPTVVEERHPEDHPYQILVPIANPEHVEQLMRTADDIATANDGEVLVMSVVTLPEQTPLSEGRRYVDQRREVLERAMGYAEERDVPVSGTIRIGHHAADAILNTIEQHGSDAVLMGWSGTPRRRDIVLGSTVDTVVQDASCDVLVERFNEEATGEVDSILFPTAGGPHADLAGEVAEAIASAEGATVKVVHVVDPDATASERRYAEDMVAAATSLIESVPVETAVLEGEDVTGAIVAETAEHDLTIIGATQEGLLQELVFGSVPVRVGQRAENTVIMTKRNLGVVSRLGRWLRWR